MIDSLTFNVLVSIFGTGIATLYFGKSGFLGAMIGHLVWYAVIRGAMFG